MFLLELVLILGRYPGCFATGMAFLLVNELCRIDFFLA